MTIDVISTGGAASKRKGSSRERQVATYFRGEGWLVIRSPASLGTHDLTCLKAGETPLLVEVKANTGSPFKTFGPACRLLLVQEAEKAGAKAVLAWWPAHKPLQLIPSDAWPD